MPIHKEKAKQIKKITIITSAALKRTQGKDFVEAIVYQERKSKKLITLKVQGVFVEIGSQPATSFVKGLISSRALAIAFSSVLLLVGALCLALTAQILTQLLYTELKSL